jgi:hypothetical protein
MMQEANAPEPETTGQQSCKPLISPAIHLFYKKSLIGVAISIMRDIRTVSGMGEDLLAGPQLLSAV